MNKILLLALTLCFSISVNLKAQKPQQSLLKNQAEEKEEKGDDDAIHMQTKKWYKMMQRPHANYFKIQKKFYNYLKKHPATDAPRETGEEWFKKNIYYLDTKGFVQTAPVFNYAAAPKGLPALSTVTDTTAGDWHMTGPRNHSKIGGSTNSTAGGYSFCVRMSPTNTNMMFISFLTGGLWVSSDGGNVWHLGDANLPDNKYSDIDVNAGNNNIVYAVSPEAVIKSTDGGLTWAPTSLNKSNPIYGAGPGYDIAASANPNVVVAKWGNALYRTKDGGATWGAVLSSLNGNVFDGGSPNTSEILDWSNNYSNDVFYADWVNGASSVTIYKSQDSAANWASLNVITVPSDLTKRNITDVKVATAATDVSSLFVFVITDKSYVQLYKINLNDKSVSLVRKNIVNGNLGGGDITMDIKNSNNIVFGGYYGSYGYNDVSYSTNNGQTFSHSTTVHSDIRSLCYVNGQVLVGNDGETELSINNGATFKNISSSISNIELWGFGIAFKTDEMVAACNHGPLAIRDFDGPGGWYNAFGADEQNSDINPLDPTYAISRGYSAYMVRRTGIGTYTTTAPTDVDPGREDWFNNLSVHPNLYNTYLTHTAGNYPNPYMDGGSLPFTPERLKWRNSLIRSDNNGQTINKVVYTFNDRLMSEKICISDTNRIYAIVSPYNNKLMKTTDGGSTFTDITPSTSVTGTGVRNISDVAVSDANPNEIWVSYSGVQNTCQVLHSTDGGATYTNLTSAILTSNPVTKIIFQRGTNGGVYAGSKAGVFYRNNSMTDWTKLGSGLPMVDVRNMFINYYKGKLFIGTSRGAWDHDLYEHSSTTAQISASKTIVDGCKPFVQFRDYSVNSKGGIGTSYQWTFQDGSPATSTQENPLVDYSNASTGKKTVTLKVTDQYGNSTKTLTNFITVTGVCDCSALNAPWVNSDIGSPAAAGSACYNVTTAQYTVKGSGSDIYGATDQFQYAYQSLNGNGDFIAKVLSLDNIDVWTKAGIMIRETLGAGSKNAFICMTPSNGVDFQYRVNTNGSTDVPASVTAVTPKYIRLVRNGNTFTSYVSDNKTTWTTVGTFNITMNANVYVGLAITSHADGVLASAVFGEVNLPLGLRTPENPASTTAGLDWKHYTGSFSSTDFSAATPVSTSTKNNFTISANQNDENFADQFTGFINVPTDGQYTFYTNSDDGSILLIGKTKVVDNDGLHGAQEKSGTIGLKAGKHAITVKYFEATGGNSLSVSYSGLGITKKAIPDNVLFRQSSGSIVIKQVTGSISDAATAESLSVYPNPAHNTITVGGIKEERIISVYNSRGQKIYETSTSDAVHVINMKGWANGIYVVKAVAANGQEQTFKIIKN